MNQSEGEKVEWKGNGRGMEGEPKASAHKPAA